MLSNAQFTKDPDATLDYEVDWTDWLNGDTITASAFTVPTGITLATQLHTDSKAVVWLSGGTVGSKYDVVNRITTAGGRTDDRTIRIVIQQK